VKKRLIVFFCILSVGQVQAQLAAPVKRPNVLLIVADDMNWDTPGCFGGAAREITPNIDKLASGGMRFRHAYVNISICTPSRSVMLTGLYSHNNGAEGFQRIHPGTPTLPSILNAAGYVCGTVGKPLSQEELFRWSVAYRWSGAGDENLWGRDPEMYREFSRKFFSMVKTAGQPFFLMASSHDPHRPFGGGPATRRFQERAQSSRIFKADEVRLPGLLPDLPGVRQEFAAYCTSVRRLDDMVGAVLEELEAASLLDDTIVVFMADHGMPFPGAKFNCYPDSVRSPWIIRWPGTIQSGSIDKTHMISTVDLQSTILEAVGLKPPKSDGRSFLPLLRGEKQDGRDAVFAQFHHIHGGDALPMRSVITRESAYVFNPWSNGKRRFGRLGGGAYQAMKKASREDTTLAVRIKPLELRTVEEFYDLDVDPNCLINLFTADPGNERLTEENKKLLKVLQSRLLEWMVHYRDPALESFRNRNRPEALERFVQSYRTRAANEVQALRSYEKGKGYRF